jgi:oxygen-dependent protoporphyrinogen oxidase
MNAPHVVIVGGGITGLATAYYLERMAEQHGVRLSITLVERDERLGGKVGTERIGGYLLDTGPDSFLAQKPWAVDLCRELGMADDVIAPSARKFYILLGGKLHSVPHELVALVPSKPEALWKASFLSLQAKTRASMEGLIPAQRDQEDESLSSFMRRRFGDEFALRFAEPLMGGVHAGHPERMSMRSIYPMYWAMERSKGSITRALLERRASARSNGATAAASPFVALRHGMASLLDRICARLSATRLALSVGVDALSPLASGRMRVRLSDRAEIEADAVVLTTPAFDAADLLRPLAPDAADLLAGIPYASTAVVSLAYREGQLAEPLEGSGFLVPRTEACALTGCTWSSQKWVGRAPEGMALMRAFLGYAGEDRIVEESSEEELAQTAHRSLAGLLHISGDPEFVRVYRWLRAMPQYEVGHHARLERIDGSLRSLPAVILAGSAYRGVGMPDCVRQGKEAAERALQVSLGRPTDGEGLGR